MPHISISVPTGGHRPGTTLNLDPASAAWFVNRQLATYTDEPDPPPPALQPQPATQKGRPPTAGRGSGRTQWAAYAAHLGINTHDDLTRQQLIELCDDVEATQ